MPSLRRLARKLNDLLVIAVLFPYVGIVQRLRFAEPRVCLRIDWWHLACFDFAIKTGSMRIEEV